MEDPKLSANFLSKCNADDLKATLQRLEREKISYINKLNDLESDQSEHRLVLEAFDMIKENRKCYRLVGGVLIERTANEVKPALKMQAKKIDEVIQKLEKEFEIVQKEYSVVASRISLLASEGNDGKVNALKG